MVEVVFVGDLVQGNGKTWKENNLALKHKIPIGTLVEIDAEETQSHGLRMLVASHGRDCDGSPLYSLTHSREYCDDKIEKDYRGEPRSKEYIDIYRRENHSGGWDEDALIVVPPTDYAIVKSSDQWIAGRDAALKEVADMARLLPNLVHPLFIPSIEGLVHTLVKPEA